MGGNHDAVVVILTTAPDERTAVELAERAVEERLAACANLMPGVTSIYRWRGEVTRESEVQVVFKTTSARADELQERLQAWHPYDVPEVMVLPVSAGAAPYLDWVRAEVGHAR